MDEIKKGLTLEKIASNHERSKNAIFMHLCAMKLDLSMREKIYKLFKKH